METSATALPKPIDRWLWCLGTAAAVLTWIFPAKTALVVSIGLFVVFACLVHPVWNFWYVEGYLPRRIIAIVSLASLLTFLGFQAPIEDFKVPETKLEPKVAPPNDEVPPPEKKTPKASPVSLPLKKRALGLSEEISRWQTIREHNRPIPSLGNDPNLHALERQTYQDEAEQFKVSNRQYWNEHFADRVTKTYLELVKRGVFVDDANNDCRNPIDVGLMGWCAGQLRTAANKLP